jgi:hypothetical protein
MGCHWFLLLLLAEIPQLREGCSRELLLFERDYEVVSLSSPPALLGTTRVTRHPCSQRR